MTKSPIRRCPPPRAPTPPMTVMALMAARRFALFTSRPRALGSTCNVADADDAPLAVSVSGTGPVGCSSTEADGSARRLSVARRRACRSCRSTVCSATAPQKRSTSPSSPAVSRTRSRSGSAQPMAASCRSPPPTGVRTSSVRAWRAHPGSTHGPPEAAGPQRQAPPAARSRDRVGSGAVQAGRLLRSEMKAGPALFATCRTSSLLDGKPANKLSCPLVPHGHR
jgi:hypothetical protein